MIERCECGEVAADCTAAWDACLVLEFQDPAYGAVHHLTVPAFMLQHGSRLSADGWRTMRDLLHRFIVDGVTPEAMRPEARAATSVPGAPSLSRRDERGPGGMRWRRAITGVRRDDAAEYRQDVIAWATSTLEDAERSEASG